MCAGHTKIAPLLHSSQVYPTSWQETRYGCYLLWRALTLIPLPHPRQHRYLGLTRTRCFSTLYCCNVPTTSHRLFSINKISQSSHVFNLRSIAIEFLFFGPKLRCMRWYYVHENSENAEEYKIARVIQTPYITWLTIFMTKFCAAHCILWTSLSAPSWTLLQMRRKNEYLGIWITPGGQLLNLKNSTAAWKEVILEVPWSRGCKMRCELVSIFSWSFVLNRKIKCLIPT